MPIYEYECINGHVTERWFSLATRADRVACETCKDRLARRIISRANTNVDVPADATLAKNSKRESDYDRNLMSAFPPPWRAGRGGA
jgi:putative FmdB family regulatory protein